MKSNRCECGNKKAENVDVCFKCAHKVGVLEVYGHGPVEVIGGITIKMADEKKEEPIEPKAIKPKKKKFFGKK